MTTWVLVVVPMLLLMLVTMVAVLPRVAATAWDSLGRQRAALAENWAAADLAGIAVGALSMLAISLPLLSMVYLLTRISRRAARRTWQATESRPPLRFAAVLFGVALVGFILWAWMPKGQYEPIHATERGTITDIASTVTHVGNPTLASSLRELPDATVALGTTPAAPTGGTSVAAPAAGAITVPPALEGAVEAWPFPFNPPRLPRDAGDNQARAVNIEDNQTVFVLALSRIWIDVDDDDIVDNRNEAYTLANCINCDTVAVAFQLLVIAGQHDTIAPQNVAMAINYLCARCTTLALAIQLVISVPEEVPPATIAALDAIWNELTTLASVAPEDVPARLQQIQEDIVAVLSADPVPVAATESTTTTTTASTTSTSASTGSSTTATVESTTTTTAPPETTTTTTEAPPETTTAPTTTVP